MPADFWAAIGKAAAVVAVLVAGYYFVFSVLLPATGCGDGPGEKIMNWIERLHRRPR